MSATATYSPQTRLPLVAGVVAAASTVVLIAPFDEGTKFPITKKTHEREYLFQGTAVPQSDKFRPNITNNSSDDASIGLFVEPVMRPKIDELQRIVRNFKQLKDGWEDVDSLAPERVTIDDAIIVLQNWPSELPLPEPTVGDDGHIVLEVYDAEGYTLGGVELMGDNNAIFTVISRTKIKNKGRFKTNYPAELLRSLREISETWA